MLTSCSQSSDLLDELDHLSLLDCARIILVELTEALVEVLVIESRAVRHVRESVADELLCLILVQVTVAICVIFSPDFIDTLGDNLIDFRVSTCVSHLLRLSSF